MAAGEKVRDLLQEGPPGRSLDIKHGPTGIFLPGLLEKQVPLGCLCIDLLWHQPQMKYLLCEAVQLLVIRVVS